ncbi:inositol 1,4,5-triphosphate receptor associated 1-like [Megalops cyprinoides]|uniref:inositol 1,4,5-triphosphate receptor associated 1-like n=1 Tax=Megalops cyprinoides TaxID=118141 RepID=UPI001863C414|nr:inositol 1,4,5-triphosphate receptor associated 1-like [Megalops cyprinoides]
MDEDLGSPSMTTLPPLHCPRSPTGGIPRPPHLAKSPGVYMLKTQKRWRGKRKERFQKIQPEEWDETLPLNGKSSRETKEGLAQKNKTRGEEIKWLRTGGLKVKISISGESGKRLPGCGGPSVDTQISPIVSRPITMALPLPTIVFPKQVGAAEKDPRPLGQDRPHSPRSRLSRNFRPSSGNPMTTVDNKGNVIDLVRDQLPELQLSEEDRIRNLELLEEAKRVSERFLTRRGRRSTSSLSESSTAGLSPNATPRSSPLPSRHSSLTVPPQVGTTLHPQHQGVEAKEVSYISPPLMEQPGQKDAGPQVQENSRNLVDLKPSEKRKVSSGTLSPRHSPRGPPIEGGVKQKESSDAQPGGERERKVADKVEEEGLSGDGPRRVPGGEVPATSQPKPVPRTPAQQVPCTAEIRTIGAFPPLMRAVTWDTVSSIPARNGAQGFLPKSEGALPPFNKPGDSQVKASGYKDFPMQPVKMQKLAKLREEHKLIRNQSIGGSKLPDLSETAEQERGTTAEEEPPLKEQPDVMPNISDVFLRKLKLHRALSGSAPPLTEKEVENAFVQLSLAFRNDNYTLETRLRQAERERNLTEENTEKELEDFKGSLKTSVTLWQNSEQRESYQRLLETVAVLHRLATRLSSRAEMVGAVRQEKRMNKATEVMMQYVENLKRTYEKDHAELMEFKKLANQNSNRCYGPSVDTGDDGVPRGSRSMSLTLGKALPRRRVSVAVVPKFNLLNIPGQAPATANQALPVVCEANGVKCSAPAEPAQQAVTENGKTQIDQESQTLPLAKPLTSPEEIGAEIKARIEEDAYNKGYVEGLRRSKELQQLKEEEEKQRASEEQEKEEAVEKRSSSKYEGILDTINQLCPKIFRRNRLIWVALTLLTVMFMVGLFTYFGDCHSELEDASTGKSVDPGRKNFFGWNVAFQSKNSKHE